MTAAQRYRRNLSEIRRLQRKVATGDLGRNSGATFAALDRRLKADKGLLQAAAREEQTKGE